MPEPKQKPDVTLSDGTEVVFDKHHITPKEWRTFIDPESDPEECNRILARFSGLDFEEVDALNMYDWQLLVRVAAEKVREPVVPNSQSASTSPS